MSAWIELVAGSISERSRSRKWSQFLDLIQPGENDTIIDVGINAVEYSPSDNYLERRYIHPEKITAVGIEADLSAFQARYPSVTVRSADGTALPFADDTFDIAYSNAVIEHVGDSERQHQFLAELYRVASRGYLTMPNRSFPVEIHTRIPLLHLILPKAGFDWFTKKVGKGWAAGDYMRLLTGSELQTLATEIGMKNTQLIANRLFGLPMTYTLIWNKRP